LYLAVDALLAVAQASAAVAVAILKALPGVL
jgi:hypothetical protein